MRKYQMSDAMDAADNRQQICSVCFDGECVEMNKMIVFFVIYNKTI